MDSKNKSYGKKLRNKRILSVFLTLLMVVSMLPISAFQVTANAADDITVKVHFRNTSNWGQVYVYAGDGASWTPLLTSTWPGVSFRSQYGRFHRTFISWLVSFGSS